METSRLALLQELSLRETQLVIAVVIDKSSGNTSIKSRTTEIPLNFDSPTLVFIKGRIFKKRTKNKAKNDKTKHGMEKTKSNRSQ
ncbi:hypothetical protein Tco_0435866, partial [Tanacetum coccineum]